MTSAWDSLCAGGFRWCVQSGQREVLLGEDGLRLKEWIERGLARIVKKGPHRIVFRVDLPSGSIYVKQNLVPDWPSRLRQLIRPSKARMEFDRAREVAARGVPTFVPLALGESQTFLGLGESYLVTRTLDRTEPLYGFASKALASLELSRQARVRHHLAEELGRFVARIHEAGIVHSDLHAGNILVRLDDDDRISLFLIDLDGARLGKPLSWRQSRHNLVILNRWFVLRASRSDRHRFWKSYYQSRRGGVGCEDLGSRQNHPLADDLEKRTWVSNIDFWRYRDGRCLKNNRYYRKVGSGNVVGHAVTDLDAQTLASLTADPDEPFRRPGTKLLKDSTTSTVAELDIVVDGQPRTVIYKRFRLRKWSAPLAGLFRPTPALRSWIFGQGFRERGLPTARALAVLHRKRFGLWYEGYLLTEKIDNAQELLEFLTNIQELPDKQRRQVLRQQVTQVAQVVREMHRRSLSHRDLKSANVLVSRDVSTFMSPFSSSAWSTAAGLLPIFASTVWLIDLVGVESHRRLPRSKKVQNLSRLNASFFESPFLTRTDRVRFLRTYMGWELHGDSDWKTWWRAVEQATLNKVARNKRTGRPLG